MELGRFLGSLHPALVHFPIVLLLVGVACDVLALIRRQDRFAWMGLGLTLVGTAAALVAFVCGILAEVFAARAGTPLEPMEAHEWMATLTTWLFMALASFRLFMGATPKRGALTAYLLFACLGCAMLVVTAKRGGELVYEYGANGGGVKAGARHGETDEVGHKAAVNKVHINDLHATILHLLGINHEKLTYRFNGRDFRLTDVAGNVVKDIIA